MSDREAQRAQMQQLPLSARPEVGKMARLLDCPFDAACELARAGGEDLERLRHGIEQQLFAQRRRGFRRLARVARLLPARSLARLASEALGPLLTARTVAQMDPIRVRNIARHVSPEFVADVAAHIDPDSVRVIVPQLPTELVREAALLLVARADHVTMGRFADALSPQALRAVVGAIDDDEPLLRAAYYLENREQLARIVHNIDNARLMRIMQFAAKGELLPEALFIIDHVTDELKGRLADLMGQQDEPVLDALVTVTREQRLWGPVLRALTHMDDRYCRKIVNLPSLRDEALLGELVATAYEEDLLATALPLARQMRRALKRVVASAALQQGEEIAAAALEAAQVSGEWATLLDLAQHISEAERDLIAGLPILQRPDVAEPLLAAVHSAATAATAVDIVARAPEATQRNAAKAMLRDGAALLELLLDHCIDDDDALGHLLATLERVSDAERPLALRVLGRRDDDERQRLVAAAKASDSALVSEALTAQPTGYA